MVLSGDAHPFPHAFGIQQERGRDYHGDCQRCAADGVSEVVVVQADHRDRDR